MNLDIEQKAPDFVAITDNSTEISLSQFADKWVVLYFYPKDNTSGCTKEACAFRDNYERLINLNAEIIGVSPDSPKSHTNFKDKFELNFTLISDESKELCKKYQVWIEKSMYGRKYMGVERTTFVIAPNGIIKYIFNKVKVDGHIDQVIEKVLELQGK
jgi:thioredoxin-dependent peroxiredoxin